MTRNAKAFKTANAKSGVWTGRVAGPDGGMNYALKNGQKFTLTASECRAVGDVYWHGLHAAPLAPTPED